MIDDDTTAHTDAGTGSSGTGFTIRRGGKSGLEEPGARSPCLAGLASFSPPPLLIPIDG